MAKRKPLGEAAKGGKGHYEDISKLKAAFETGKEAGRTYEERYKRMTFHLPVELTERLRNAVYWTPGLTLAGLAEQALEAELSKLEKKNGEPFAERPEKLKGGRPIGS